MNWLKSPLFWKITGTYAVLSGVGLVGLLVTISGRATDADPASGAIAQAGVSAAITVYILALMAVAIVTAGLTSHLASLVTSTRPYQDPVIASNLLTRLVGRNDELSTLAERLQEFVTDRNEASKSSITRLVVSSERLNTVLQAMTEGVIAIDEKESIQFANHAVCRMLELSAGRVEGRLIFEAVRNTHVHDAVRQALTEGRTTTVEFKVPRNESRLALAATPIDSGGAVLVLADVTEMRKLEAMRRDFVSGVSHELKTPLTVIQACTETLLHGAMEDRAAAERFLVQIEEQADRLLQLIIGMMQLARLESGEQIFHKEAVDLRPISDKAVSLMQTVADSRSINLQVRGVEELFVLSDHQATRTIVDNLVDNALKYTPEGGSVTLELIEEPSQNTLKVIDTGQGIPEGDHERVFERFYRVERDRSSETGGTGMGLAIVKHLCQAVGADVTLESQQGAGTTFSVTFPITE
ncbi:MAG: ATP-binding protein [Planctomycetaceae bacterium]|nr:ATP-binding protein [Planctomycetaceae bacterium]